MSVFGLVAEALARRRDSGIASPTIVSCDNIEGNGEVARQAFTSLRRAGAPRARRSGSPRNTRFPNSMVDRITPGHHTRGHRRSSKDEFGVEDQWPVVAEPFTSWVLEDDFSDGRPPFEDVDVLLVDDVHAVRADEAAAAQRQPPKPLLFRLSGGLPAGARRSGRSAVRRIPDAVHGFRGDADTEAGAGHRSARVQAHPDRAVRQPRRARHHRPAVLRLVGPHPEMAASGDPGEPGHRRADPAVGGDGRQLGALRRRRRRAGRADRRPGPAGRHACAAGSLTARESDGVHRKHRCVRRSRHVSPVRRGVPDGRSTRCIATGRGRRWRR